MQIPSETKYTQADCYRRSKAVADDDDDDQENETLTSTQLVYLVET